jgi:hydroxyacylglutathione hydrolase
LDILLEKKSPLPLLARRPRHVHNITDRFSMANTYLIDDGRLIVVDPSSIFNVRLTLDYLQRFLRRSPRDIDLIVLTRLHPDHSTGVETLRRACHAPIAASIIAHHLAQKWRGENLLLDEKKATNINTLLGQVLLQRSRPGLQRHPDPFSPNYMRQMQMVDLWLDDVVGLPNHPDWRIIATPGYTPESLCLYNPFSYELLCGEAITSIDNGSTLMRNYGNRRLLEETLNTLRKLKVYYLYPGHGRPILGYRPLAATHIE